MKKFNIQNILGKLDLLKNKNRITFNIIIFDFKYNKMTKI